MKAKAVATALCMLSWSARGQSNDSLASFFTVFTEPAQAEVYLDSARIGPSPVEGIRLMAGRHHVLLAYPAAAEWNALSMRDTIVLLPGDTLIKHYSLGTFVRIQTEPSGAVIGPGDSALGITPFVYRSLQSIPVTMVLRKEEYRDTAITLQPSEGSVRIMLSPEARDGPRSDTRDIPDGPEPERDQAWAAYAAAASTIASGIATVYFKHQADRDFDLYVSSNQSKYLDATKKYDRAAIWTLVLTQVSFGLLVYFLFE